MKRLIVVLIVIVLLIPEPSADLVDATWSFLGALAATLAWLFSGLWLATPETIRPLWGMLGCGVVLIFLLSGSLIQALRRLRGHL